MGPLFSQDRLQDTVHRTTAPVSGPNLFPTVSKSVVGRSCQPPSKRGSGGNSPGKSRVLFTDFPCSKKEWKSKADYRPVNSVGTQTLHYVSYNIPRSDYQLPEIRPHSYSNFHFHRDGISDLFQHCQSSTFKSSETIGNNHDHLSENINISQSFPFSFGTTQCSSGFCNARQTTSPTIANVPALSMETTKIFTGSPNQDISEHFTPS